MDHILIRRRTQSVLTLLSKRIKKDINMKKIKVIFLIALLTTGCSGYLDEEFRGQIVGNASLSTVEGLDAALVGTYKGLTNTWGTGFLHPTAIGATMGGEDVTTHKASNKQEFREFDQFAVSAGNSRTGNLYNGCYKAIQGANNIINNYEYFLLLSQPSLLAQ